MNVFVEQQQEKLVRAGLLLSLLIWTKFGYFSGPKIRATTCFPEYSIIIYVKMEVCLALTTEKWVREGFK